MNLAVPLGLRGEPCAAQGSGSKGGFSFAKENTPFGTPRERLALAVCSSKSCGACRIGCLPGVGDRRFGLLLSSLSLCLRFVTPMQSPSTSDLFELATACQGGFAALAAIFVLSVEGDYTALALRFESDSG